jgi:hypothetical protein
VGPRLWLAGALSPRRDQPLIHALIGQIRTVAPCRPVLFAADGFGANDQAIRLAFRSKPPTGRVGRPRLIAWPDVAIVQVVKHRSGGQLDIRRRLVQGSSRQLAALLLASRRGRHPVQLLCDPR